MNIIQRIEVIDLEVYVKFSDLKYDKAPIFFSANIASASIYYYEEIAMNQPDYLSCAKLHDQLFEMVKVVKVQWRCDIYWHEPLPCHRGQKIWQAAHSRHTFYYLTNLVMEETL